MLIYINRAELKRCTDPGQRGAALFKWLLSLRAYRGSIKLQRWVRPFLLYFDIWHDPKIATNPTTGTTTRVLVQYSRVPTLPLLAS